MMRFLRSAAFGTSLLFWGCGTERVTAVEGSGAPADGAVPTYTLVVDAPANYSTVSGIVTISGHTSGFVNVEVWDATHQHPPLAQTPPDAENNFVTTVNTSTLALGPTDWTVFAWDAAPGQAFEHDDSVTLYLTIEAWDAGSIAR